MAGDKDDPWRGSNRKAEEDYRHPDPDRPSGDLDEDDTQDTEKESKSKSDDA